jgi:hypothetical protein
VFCLCGVVAGEFAEALGVVALRWWECWVVVAEPVFRCRCAALLRAAADAARSLRWRCLLARSLLRCREPHVSVLLLRLR